MPCPDASTPGQGRHPDIAGAGTYVCANTATPNCDVVSVAALVRLTGVDPFPAPSVRGKDTAMALPAPEESSCARGRHRSRREHGVPDQLPGQ